MYADSPPRPARALLTLLGGAWPLLAAGGLFAATRLTPSAAPVAPRQDATRLRAAPGPSADALYLPLAAFQCRRYRAALHDLARAPDAPQAPHWRGVRDGSLYTYRMERRELAAATAREAHLPDL